MVPHGVLACECLAGGHGGVGRNSPLTPRPRPSPPAPADPPGRLAEMFDIMVDYPDSAPAVEDMAECLHHTHLGPEFVAGVRAALRGRLLHAGAATVDIIATYVSAIRVLSRVDPSGMRA